MRDFPIFTTQYGIASLILKEIPYRGTAYIRLEGAPSEHFREHLEECISFCRMAGAEKIYAAGDDGLEVYPLDGSILEMRGEARVDTEKMVSLFPVTEKTAGQWRAIYNRTMASVPHAATLESREEQRIADAPGTYFIHQNGILLGIGWMEDRKLLAVAGVERGCGEILMHTLMSLVEGADVTLEVASANDRAIRLYERLGFVKTKEKTRWYDVSNPLSF